MKDIEIIDSDEELQELKVQRNTGLVAMHEQHRIEADRRRLIVINLIRLGIRNQAEIRKVLREEYDIVVSAATIYQDLKIIDDEFRVRIANRVDEERAIDLDRMEVAISAVMRPILDNIADSKAPDLNAIKTLTVLLERKAKMLGYDSPLKVDIRELIIRRAEAEGIDPLLALEIAGQLQQENT